MHALWCEHVHARVAVIAQSHQFENSIVYLLSKISTHLRFPSVASLSTDAFEAVQCRNTKFILNDYTSDYKSRLLSLQLLPQMMLYELNDVLLFVKSLRSLMLPLMFMTVSHLVPQHPTTSLFTNLRELTLPRTLISMDSFVCGIISPLSTSISVSHQLKSVSKLFFWNHFVNSFDPNKNSNNNNVYCFFQGDHSRGKLQEHSSGSHSPEVS